MWDERTATHEALGAACALSPELVLVARPSEQGLLCVAANQAFTERFAPGTEPAGRPVARLLPAPIAAAFAARASTVLSSGEPLDYEDGVADAGYGRLAVTVRVAPVTTSAGEPLVAWMGREREARADLAVRNDRLRREKTELERSNFDLSEFAYLASHDLAEPLRMVTSYLELLSTRHAGALDEQAQRYLAFAADGAVRMRALIDDVLALARVSAVELRLAPVDLSAVVARACHDLGAAIDEAGADVVVGPLPVVTGDGAQLARLLANLLANAVKFRGDAPPVVTVAAAREGDAWRVTVADNGIGIAPEFQPQVFHMFRRLHSRAAYGGTGMGLAIGTKIVGRHGGRIGVESEPGGGTTFWFTLPDNLPPVAPTGRDEDE